MGEPRLEVLKVENPAVESGKKVFVMEFVVDDSADTITDYFGTTVEQTACLEASLHSRENPEHALRTLVRLLEEGKVDGGAFLASYCLMAMDRYREFVQSRGLKKLFSRLATGLPDDEADSEDDED